MAAARASGRRGRRESGGGRRIFGLLTSLLGAVAIISAGFAFGLVLGVVSDEPELLFGHLVGRSEEVPWTRATEPEERPSDRAVAPSPPPRVAAPPPEPGEAPAESHFAIQVGAFRESAAAEGLADTLRGKGLPVYITPGSGSPDGRWRVRVGPLSSKAKADLIARRLKAEERLPTWILSE